MGSIRHSADAAVADERVDFIALLEEEVHQLDEQHTAEGGHDERTGTEAENHQRLAAEEHRSLGRGTYGDADEQGADIDHSVGGHIGEALGDTALFQQVAEEEHTEQRQAARHDEGAEKQTDDGEGNLL